jgi:hypothetical protein
MNQHKNWTHRVRSMILVVLFALGALTVSAAQASAERTCSGSTRVDICLWIRHIGGDQYNVHVGFDYKIGRLDAEAIMAQPGDPADAWIMGDDTFFDNAEFRVPIQVAVASDLGLSIDFDINVPYAALDEDSDGADELYARVRVFDNRTPGDETFTTRTLTSPFPAED